VISRDNPELMTLLGKLWIPMGSDLRAGVCVTGTLHADAESAAVPGALHGHLATQIVRPHLADALPALAGLAILAVRAAAAGQRVKGLNATILWMALVCSPMVFLGLHGIFYFGQVTALLLLVLVWFACRHEFPNLPLEYPFPGVGDLVQPGRSTLSGRSSCSQANG
jgi:hypothetical protein